MASSPSPKINAVSLSCFSPHDSTMVARTLQALPFMPQASRIGTLHWPNYSLPSNLVCMSGHYAVPVPSWLLVGKFRPMSPIIRAIGGSDQVDDSRNPQARDSKSAKILTWMQPTLNFAGRNFLPLALVSGVTLGLAYPTLGCLADKYSLSKFSTFGIFLISGLMLRSGDIGAAVEAWPAGLFGLPQEGTSCWLCSGGFVLGLPFLTLSLFLIALGYPTVASILLFTPSMSRLISQLQLVPQEFVTGLAIFCCMPTTLSSGVALTQLVGGNSALALAMTVLSNLLGILIVPFSISMFVGKGAGVSIPTIPLFKSLITSLLVPLVMGKVFRDSFRNAGEYVDQNRQSFSRISAIILSLVPWIQVSRSRLLLLSVKPAVFLVAIGLGMLLHLSLLAINTIVVWSLSVLSGSNKSVFTKKENARAVIIVASQKTLPVTVAVVDQLGGALGESGLLVLPCVAAHINQIIIDSFLVNFWLWKDQLPPHPKDA